LFEELRGLDKRTEKDAIVQKLRSQPLPPPDGQFDVIVVDPPWRYQNRAGRRGEPLRKFIQRQGFLTDEFKDDITAEFIRGERKLGKFWAKQPKNPGTRLLGGGDGAGGAVLAPPANMQTPFPISISTRSARRAIRR
jgi:hypothetical protein